MNLGSKIFKKKKFVTHYFITAENYTTCLRKVKKNLIKIETMIEPGFYNADVNNKKSYIIKKVAQSFCFLLKLLSNEKFFRQFFGWSKGFGNKQ